eukprot:1269074-Prymnesium_polylepis.1
MRVAGSGWRRRECGTAAVRVAALGTAAILVRVAVGEEAREDAMLGVEDGQVLVRRHLRVRAQGGLSVRAGVRAGVGAGVRVRSGLGSGLAPGLGSRLRVRVQVC